MKKWKLLKDLPGVKAGAIFVRCTLVPNLEYIVENGLHPVVAFDRPTVEDNPDFFELVKPERWKPKIGDRYWVISHKETLTPCDWEDTAYGRGVYSLGNCFQTEAQALEASRRVKETLLKYQEELTNE